jgi:hypothetical protein
VIVPGQEMLEEGLVSGPMATACKLAVLEARRQKFAVNQDQGEQYYGLTFDNLWGFEEASSPVLDLIASVDLTQTSDPTFGTSTIYGERSAVTFIINDGNRVANATTSNIDVTTGSFGFFGHIITGVAPGLTRDILGKYSTNGYTLRMNSSGHLLWLVKGAGGQATVTLAVDHANAYVTFWCGLDTNSGDQFIYTNLSSGTADGSGHGSLTNAGQFRVGTVTSQATDFTACLLGFVDGAGAEGKGAEIVERAHRGP